MNSDQDGLLAELAALQAAVASTATLKTVLDDTWFEAIEAAIRESLPEVDRSGFIYDFCHPLRGTDWFEEAQRFRLEGRLDEVSEDGKFILRLIGPDPLLTVLPLLESRLHAFRTTAIKPDTVQSKFAVLQASRFDPSFKNHLFELSVLGDLALKGVLVDIEDSTTMVDGVIDIDNREILVEVTNTLQRVIPDSVGVFSIDPNVGIDQVIKKLHKKAAEGRQLARANGKPALLFLARTHLGADRHSAHVALRECFANPDFSVLSGVVLADSWKLYVTSWHPGTCPDVPLSEAEIRKLASWYGISS